MDDTYEHVLLVKNEVFIFMIPPRTSNRAVRASDWKLDAPDWIGRLKLINKGDKCFIRLEDKTSGQEYAKCPIDKYPGIAIEPVSDSSRYFVIRVQDDNGRAAFIGIGFADRGDSFDLNVALQDHFKLVEKQCKLEQEALSDNHPKLDLKFKEGQTIKVNLNIKKSGSLAAAAKPKPKVTGNITGILPPPPGGLKLPNSSSAASKQEKSTTSLKSSDQITAKETKISNTTLGDPDNLNDFCNLTLSQTTTSNLIKTGQEVASKGSEGSSDDLWANFEDAFSEKLTNHPSESTTNPSNTPQSDWACF